MQTSEFEYYLLAELITMHDRILAQQIELLIWNKHHELDKRMLDKFVELIRQSNGELDFQRLAKEFLVTIGSVHWTIVNEVKLSYVDATTQQRRVFRLGDVLAKDQE